ncbi:MAG: hypothetical protein V7642_2660 [Burkholderiales bacterium]|jgi:hypothetical protein
MPLLKSDIATLFRILLPNIKPALLREGGDP